MSDYGEQERADERAGVAEDDLISVARIARPQGVRGEVIADKEEARRALQLLLDKYAPHLRPGRDYRAITDDELARTAVYRVRITEWSGKRKHERPDFPGAFLYQPGAVTS